MMAYISASCTFQWRHTLGFYTYFLLNFVLLDGSPKEPKNVGYINMY
jgi:hypothetical protein